MHSPCKPELAFAPQTFPFHCSASTLLNSSPPAPCNRSNRAEQDSDMIQSVTCHCCMPSRRLGLGSQVRSSGLTSPCPTTTLKQLSLSDWLLPLYRNTYIHTFFPLFPPFSELTLAFLHSESSWDAGSFVKMYLMKVPQNAGFRPEFLKVISYFLNQALGPQIGQRVEKST